MKEINSHQLQRALKDAGYEKIRNGSGSHAIYSNGTHKITVPMVNLNSRIATKIIQKCGLKSLI